MTSLTFMPTLRSVLKPIRTLRASRPRQLPAPFLPHDPEFDRWIATLRPLASTSSPLLPFDPEFERWIASLEPLSRSASQHMLLNA